MGESGTVETPAAPARSNPSGALRAPEPEPVVGTGTAPAPPEAKTRAWLLARVLLAIGGVLLALSAVSALRPLDNPGVQTCGGAVPFLVSGGDNRVIHIGDTGRPDEAAHSRQPTCRERALGEAGRAGRLFMSAIVVLILGAALGLIDDHIAYRREPRYETFLRDLPYEGRARRGLVPRVSPGELVASLPPLERPEVVGIIGWSVVALALLPFAGPPDAVLAALREVQIVPLVVAAAAMAATWPAAAGLRHRLVPPTDPPEGLTAGADSRSASLPSPGAGALVEAVAGSWQAALRPLTGAAGVDVFHLRRRGVPAADAVADTQVLVTLSLVLHLVLLAPIALVVALDRHPPAIVKEPQLVLIGVAVALGIVGACRLRIRWRGLPVRPSWAAFTRFDQLAPRLPDRVLVIGLTVAQPVLRGLVLALALSAFGARVPALVIILVALLGPVALALAPTPGGAGAVEAVTALLLMLVAGVDPGRAVCVALVVRLLTFWLPAVPGRVVTRRYPGVGGR